MLLLRRCLAARKGGSRPRKELALGVDPKGWAMVCQDDVRFSSDRSDAGVTMLPARFEMQWKKFTEPGTQRAVDRLDSVATTASGDSYEIQNSSLPLSLVFGGHTRRFATRH
jgi:hypothetical protein